MKLLLSFFFSLLMLVLGSVGFSNTNVINKDLKRDVVGVNPSQYKFVDAFSVESLCVNTIDLNLMKELSWSASVNNNLTYETKNYLYLSNNTANYTKKKNQKRYDECVKNMLTRVL